MLGANLGYNSHGDVSVMSFGTDLHMPVAKATILRHPARSALSTCFIAKQQATPHFFKILDMLLHAQQVMPPYGYICDV